MKKMMAEFKEFIMRGNVMDLAVGVIIGGAFGAIVSSLCDDVIVPFIQLIIGKALGVESIEEMTQVLNVPSARRRSKRLPPPRYAPSAAPRSTSRRPDARTAPASCPKRLNKEFMSV